MHPAASFLRGVAQFWIGDLIGVVVTTPALLVATRGRRNDVHLVWWETLLQAGAIVTALWVVFGSGLGDELKLFYVLFLPLIWIAMRRGLAGTTAAALLVQIGLIAALLFVGHKPGEVLEFQFLMLALALTGLFLGVTVEERRAAEQRLRAKQFELDRSLRAAAASELATTLAHELNQPLSAVASYSRAAQLLLERGDPEQELSATMNKVVAQANRAATVVRRLREFVLPVRYAGRRWHRPICSTPSRKRRARTRQRHDVQLSTVTRPVCPMSWVIECSLKRSCTISCQFDRGVASPFQAVAPYACRPRRIATIWCGSALPTTDPASHPKSSAHCFTARDRKAPWLGLDWQSAGRSSRRMEDACGSRRKNTGPRFA